MWLSEEAVICHLHQFGQSAPVQGKVTELECHRDLIQSLICS